MQEWVYIGEDLGATWELRPIRAELQDMANEWRGKMVEAAVEQDDEAMMEYLEGNEPDVPTLRKLLRKGTLAMDFVPVLGGSAFKNKGVQPLLNAVVDYLPSPLDVVDYMGFAPGDEEEVRNIARRADDSMAFSGLAFKIMNDPYMGTLTFTRIYSGTLAKGDTLMNTTKGRKERIGRMVMMHSNKQDEITEAYAGDIIALAGLKDTTTGDTLSDDKDQVVLETMTFPDPVIEIAVEPKTKADQEKMSIGLQRLAAEDPSFRVETDLESGQTIMKGTTASSVNSRLRRTSVPHRLRIVRPSVTPLSTHTPTRNSPVVLVSSARSSCPLCQPKQAKGTPLTPRLLVVRCPRNTFLASKKASTRSWTPVRWRASPSSTSRLNCSTVSSTMLTPQFWPLKSPHVCACAKA